MTLKLGKLQALAALSKQLGGLAARPKPADAFDGLAEDIRNGRLRHLAEERAERAERALAETRAALAAAEAGRRRSSLENPNPSIFPVSREPADPPDPPPRPTAMPGMPTEPLPDHLPGLHPYAKFAWSGGRQHGLGPDSGDALRMMKPGGFPGG